MLSTLRGISLRKSIKSSLAVYREFYLLQSAVEEKIKLFTEVKLAKPQWKNTQLGVNLTQEMVHKERQ